MLVEFFFSVLHMTIDALHGDSFATVHDMFGERDDMRRHRIPISVDELNSMVEFVESTRAFTPKSHPEWKFKGDSLTFQYIKRLDEVTGVLQGRSWLKIRDVPPQVVYHALHDHSARMAFDKFYIRFDVSRELDSNLDVLVSEIDLPMGMANREFVEWRYSSFPHNDEARDGRYVIYLRSCDDSACSEKVRPNTNKKKVERAEVWMSGYVITWWVENGVVVGSEVLVLSHVDSRGKLPKFALSAVGSNGPSKWAHSLEDYVKRICKEKKIDTKMSNEDIVSVLKVVRVAKTSG